MRPLLYLAAIPLVVGCARQSTLRAPSLPSDEPLRVRLYQPTGGALNYHLSEPAYVAIFAVTRGQGISLIYPHYQSQVEDRGHAGLNQETVHGGNGGWGASRARYEYRALFGHADAYYIVASKQPLPVEGMLQSPYLLRSLIGVDAFRATNLGEAWDALEAILVEGLPDDDWAADVYMNWRDPFMSVSWAPQRFLQYCNDGRSYLSTSLLDTGGCGTTRRSTFVPPIQVADLPLRLPPKEPRDREPSLPPDDPIVATSRSGSDVLRRERSGRRAEWDGSRPGRATERSRSELSRNERSRSEPARAPEREVVQRREQAAPAPAPAAPAPAPAPARPAESRPQPQPEGKRPEPKPDN